MNTKDFLIEDFTDERFKTAFRIYFEELGETVKDWEKLFLKMNNDPHGKDFAYIRVDENDHVIGFIQFTTLEVTSWFFKTQIGFIREFWIASEYRNRKHGTALLRLAEAYFCRCHLFASVLTTDTAERFYEKHGYVRMNEIIPANDEITYVKVLKNKL